ncbi:MAG: tRNA uridine-5-carboxymethylaminomethyl(34) synthesis enzyme MnmG [Gammaproteobacteria bacterium]|nr:tRNA uridine-5-carboxymethylaminomethyl(34) synthesis enzyme MnmG [Gammaproteobacteria bacterium]
MRVRSYDVIVIGAGHAGCEAAAASARMGAKTLLLTQSLDTIGQMSCNPAIGGIGKSHLVREIDALGGIMAQAADRAGIQFRVLNRSKGPAVRATRVQADRGLYRQSVRQLLDGLEDLHLFQQSVTDLLVEDGVLKGVVTQMGLEFYAPAVVMTTGTFLSGRIHIGQENFAGGRAGDAPSNALARKLRDRGLRVGRLKTGTPPRIDGRSVDYSVMEEQRGDEPLPCLSFLGEPSEHPEQRSCFITHTNEQTHELIRGALDRSPMFSGAIEGVGPRYCPSIEDKVVRFADRVAHQIFVEPEGLLTNELYPNGISTSLPFDVQIHAVRSIKGFENAHITRPGYAIEYDYYDPRELQYSLETKAMDGLFFAGQINGTTGYEEAAAQGLLAGTNAALKVSGKQAWCPRRDEAYIGVLVDDLINLGTNEPYRMFTSRAEYRLRLREDNADQRLTPVGRELGLVSGLRWERFTQKRDAVDELRRALEGVAVAQTSSLARDLSRELGEEITKDTTLVGVLRRPRATLDALADCVKPYLSQSAAEALARAEIASQVEVEVKYEGYIKRQEDEIAKVRRHERIRLPESIDFASLPGLSNELKVKLMEVQPPTLARAARIPGMTAAGLSILLVHARKHDERAGAGARG